MAWHRSAEWLTPEPIPRVSVGNGLQMRLKCRQTIVNASDCIDDVQGAREGRQLPTVVEFVREKSRAAIIEAIANLTNDRQLEGLVAELLRAEGAITATVLPKRQGQPGDFDVVAEWPPIANAKAFKVAVQVKKHEGVSGAEGIRQLIDRAPHDECDRLMLVTTAKDLTDEARMEADRGGVWVVTQDDLADWILSKGLNAIAAVHRVGS